MSFACRYCKSFTYGHNMKRGGTYYCHYWTYDATEGGGLCRIKLPSEFKDAVREEGHVYGFRNCKREYGERET